MNPPTPNNIVLLLDYSRQHLRKIIVVCWHRIQEKGITQNKSQLAKYIWQNRYDWYDIQHDLCLRVKEMKRGALFEFGHFKTIYQEALLSWVAEILIYMHTSVIYWSFVRAAADDTGHQSFNIWQLSSWLVPCLFCFHIIVSFFHMLFVPICMFFFPSKEYD